MTRRQSFQISFHFVQVVIHLNDVDGASEENLKSILETPIRDTKLPLGADVTVSRVTVSDFNECNTEDYNDCSDQVIQRLLCGFVSLPIRATNIFKYTVFPCL